MKKMVCYKQSRLVKLRVRTNTEAVCRFLFFKLRIQFIFSFFKNRYNFWNCSFDYNWWIFTRSNVRIYLFEINSKVRFLACNEIYQSKLREAGRKSMKFFNFYFYDFLFLFKFFKNNLK